MPAELSARILREFERWRLVDRQLGDLENAQRATSATMRTATSTRCGCCWTSRRSGRCRRDAVVREFFGWRQIKNRRELASLAGLAPTPYASGDSQREQGISKAGNRRVRWTAVEMAWMWLRWQPNSALSLWYQRRFGGGNARSRKVGIVALARKLLIALWRYLEQGEVPEGARSRRGRRSSTAGCRRRPIGLTAGPDRPDGRNESGSCVVISIHRRGSRGARGHERTERGGRPG